MKTEPNDQTFPFNFPDQEYFEGLTKREYFAAMAMVGELVAEIAVNYAETLILEHLEDDKIRAFKKAEDFLGGF